jgi:hypothetical protein
MLAVSALGLALALLVPASALAAARTPYSTNLVKNPGAEAGTYSPDGGAGVPIPHWETLNNFTVVRYGSPDYPSTSERNRIHGEQQFFAAGAYDNVGDQCDSALQFITIHGRGSVIDGGHVKVTLSARMGSYDGQPDTANVSLSFRDGNNEQVTTPHSNSLNLMPVSASNNRLKLRTASKILPRTTRKLRIRLYATFVGGYCDAFFDNISITIRYV